jgi:Ca-activated chloride channel family protein
VGRVCRRALTAGLAALACLAQEPVYRVDVDLVRMLVTVKNQAGELVGGLAKQDFRVTDNGVPQEVAVFERHTEQPLSIALLVDTSRSTEREQRYEVQSIKRFVKALIVEGNPNDAAALYSFNYEVTLQTPFTRRLERIENGLGRLKSEGATALYDAIYLAADDLRSREGRHVVIVVSDGGDTISKTKFQQALKALHDSNAVLYSALVVPVAGDAGRNLSGEHALTQLAEWTGGRIFFPAANETLDQTFQEILRDLRTQYLLAYYPKNVPESKERFHRVSVTLAKPGHTVSARNGYFAAR